MTDSLFDGDTIAADLDNPRLHTQLGQVYKVLVTANEDDWFTLSFLGKMVHGSESGISARIRDLRKPHWGSHEIISRRRNVGGVLGGVWEYRMVTRKPLADGQRGPSPRAEAAARVRGFLNTRAGMGAMHPNIITSVGARGEIHHLLISDLRLLLS